VGWLVLLQGLVLAFGCGGQSEKEGGGGDDDGGGTGGSSTGGTATGAVSGSATSGSSGASGTSSGGTASGGTASGGTASGGTASGGTAGEAGAPTGGTSSGGAAGEAGAPSGAECVSAADCRLVSDCCSCRAEPIGVPGELCPLDCAFDSCGQGGGVEPSEVECVMGRCVVARSCVGSVTCPALPPNCGEGRLPSVVEGCWGPCLAVTDCSAVPSCSDCGQAVCVAFDSFRGSYHCVEPADGCNAGNYCECLGACTFDCVETDDGVGCTCPVC
jgi:hypothetical protein